MVLFLAGAKDFSNFHNIQTRCGANEPKRLFNVYWGQFHLGGGNVCSTNMTAYISPPSAMAGDDGSHASTSTLLTQTIQLLVFYFLMYLPQWKMFWTDVAVCWNIQKWHTTSTLYIHFTHYVYGDTHLSLSPAMLLFQLDKHSQWSCKSVDYHHLSLLLASMHKQSVE
jgi:hypothetical protein